MENTIEIGQALCAMLQEAVAHPESLSQMEQEIRHQLLAIGREALRQWLMELTAGYPDKAVPCPYCDEEAKYERQRQGKLRTVLGNVDYCRPYYRCRHCRRGHYPLDVAMGLRPNAMSAELERLAGMTGVQMPFGQGSKVFAQLTLLELSDQSLDKAAQAYGAEMEQLESEWKKEALDTQALLHRQRESRHPLRLYGALDASKVHLRAGKENPWRDLKVGVWFEARGQPPTRPDGEWQIRAEKLTYYTDICPASEFTSLLWASGVQRNAHLAKELVFLGDAAEWIWNIVAENYPDAVQIVDWFHACEYLDPAAKAAFPEKQQQEAWVTQTKEALWEGRLDDVIDACQALIDADREDDPAYKAATYFQNNRHRMDYPAYRQQGYQIGSGTVESAAKQIGTLRMKVSGARWNEQSARRVAKARAAFLSDQWPTLAECRAHLPLAC